MKENKKRGILKPLGAFLLALVMVLTHVMGAMDVQAKADVKAPTVNDVLYDATTISGGNLAKAKVEVGNKKQTVIATVHVTLKGEDGTVKATLEVTPKRGTTWKVDLPQGVKVAKGDTVTVYQQIGDDKSPEVTANAQPSKASTVTLTMPTGEIWVEQYVANIVNDDEKAEAIDLLKKANPTIAKDIKSVEFTITGATTKTASYVVTYTDNSVSEEIQAPGLTIKPVTETSRSPEIGSITIVDNVVKGKLAGQGPFDGIKVQLVINVNKNKADQYCNENKCTVDKDSSKPIDVTLQDDGTFSYTLQAGESLKLDQIVGVSVKEPHKFVSCSTTTVKPAKVEKIEVKDPRKLTSEDKKAIDDAIRKAYTVNGVSKLPDGTGYYEEVPAVIQIDDSGNVKIFSGNDVAGTWDSEGTFVPEKNDDGSVKLNKGAEPKITIPAKDLLKNIKPEAPTVALSGDKKNITITPNEKDTDANSISVSYTGKDGSKKTTTATKDDNGTWSITGEGTVLNGVITLPVDKVKGGTDVTAKVTDKGGVADDDTTPLISEPGTFTVKETIAEKVEALGGLSPVDLKKWVGDEVDWKKGVKAKDDTKKEDVDKLLDGATFEDVTDTARTTKTDGKYEGKVKVKFSDDSEIIVEKQMLYVSDLVSPSNKENLPDDALEVEFKLGEGTKVDNTDGTSITGPNSYQKYKVKPNTNLKEYKIPAINTSVVDSIKVTPQEGYIDPVWRDSKNGTNFVATANNKVFTATATKTYKVTLDPNGGGGTKSEETKKSGEKYSLPKGDTFTPPANKEFAGWLVGDATTTTDPGTEITINSDTVIKASWKPIMVDVSFDKGEGSGSKEKVSVAKGSEYTLPDGKEFTPPENQVFDGWKVGNEEKAVGDKITVNENTTVTAKYKPIMVDISFDKGEGSGSKEKVSVAKGSEYTLPDGKEFTPPENQVFDGWKVGNEEKAVGDKITVNENTTVTAKYKPIMVDISFDKGEGSGSKEKVSVAKGSEYTLPDGKEFTPPENQVFDGWKVGNEEKAVGDKITVNENTTVTAKYKPIMVDVSFDKGEGSGSKEKVSVAKGSEYTLPDSEGFTPPANQEFAGWEVDGVAKKVGDKITVTENTTVTATWKAKGKPEDPSKPSDPKKPSAPAITWRGLWYLGEKTEPAKAVQEMEIGRHYKYLYGYVDKTVRPEGMITRSEAAALIARLAELDMTDKTKPNFKDTPSAWYNSAINIMVKKDLMFGDKNGNFRPNEPITRGEFARALYYIDKKNDKVAPFADVKGHEFEAAINQAYGNDRIAGYPDGSFKPNAYIQRAEAARILNQYADRNVNIPGMEGVKKGLIRFTDINENHWAYCEIMEAANSHEYQRAKGTLPETWLKILDK